MKKPLVWCALFILCLTGTLAIAMVVPPGLIAEPREEWRQDYLGSNSTHNIGEYERFGYALACGRLNRGIYEDLIVGIPGQDREGGINVIHGSSVGLSAEVIGNDHLPAQYWDQDTEGILEKGESFSDIYSEVFGDALITGDFDGNGFDDIAVANTQETSAEYDPPLDFNLDLMSGGVNVIYGYESGLDKLNNQFFHPDSGFRTAPGRFLPEGFGSALATGDFNADGRDDLAIGAPAKITGFVNVPGSPPDIPVISGAVYVIYGSENGLELGQRARTEYWSQTDLAIPGSTEIGDGFGSSLAVGDFDLDGADDLVIGVPGENLDWKIDAGRIVILYGKKEIEAYAGGLTGERVNSFSQRGAVAGKNERGDRFGGALATGDFDGDLVDDLAVGVPGEDIGDCYWFISCDVDAGSVVLMYGAEARGLSSDDTDSISQSGEVPGSPEDGDVFGASLAAGDFNGDEIFDLAVGVPGEDLGNCPWSCDVDAGMVNVFYGTGDGLTRAASDGWNQNNSNIVGTPEDDDYFGFSLVACDFNGDGSDELAIGAPAEDLGSVIDAGGVYVLHGIPRDGQPGNTRPIAITGGDRVLEANDECKSVIKLDASASYDPDGDLLSFVWSIKGNQLEGPVQEILVSPGIHTFTLAINDGKGGETWDEVTVKVIDMTPPDIKVVSANPAFLWPPNHKMQNVVLETQVIDNCSSQPECKAVEISSSEDDQVAGDRHDQPGDFYILESDLINLRAERTGNGPGRVYSVYGNCSDEVGNFSEYSLDVPVPHDMK